LLATPFGLELSRVAIADLLAFHGRALTLFAVLAHVLAAPIVGVTRLEKRVFLWILVPYPSGYPAV
jgi:hypothetical protein